MALPFDAPLSASTLVGRGPQLGVVERCLQHASSGRGRVLLVSGEAGIGKSRLLCEAETYATKRGFRVLHGGCFESERELPYAPLLDLLRTLFTSPSGEIIEAAGGSRGELIALLPELGALLHAPDSTTRRAPSPDRLRLFHALAEFVSRLCAAQPLLVGLEDVHWSDDASLEFLRYLARRLTRQPILLVLTYRSDEVHPGLAATLAELDRERLATELALPLLTIAEVGVLLRGLFSLGRPVRLEFLDALYAFTEGNPFFVEEVLRALVAEGGIYYADGAWDRKPLDELRIPRSVQEAVRRRLERLSGEARDVLSLAAVAGRRFEFALLQALTGREEAELLPLLKEAIAAQLVVDESAERFSFRHALTRQAVYTRLLARERRALHCRIGETVERLYGDSTDPPLADLASHFFLAGDWVRVLDYARRAGEQAQTLYAPRAAVQQFSRALDAAQHLGLPPPADLHRARGLAYATLGEFERALEDHEASLEATRQGADRGREWQALLDIGLLWQGHDYARARDYFQASLELARAMDDSRMLGHSLNRLGNWCTNLEQPREASRYHQEALELFQSLDDRPGIAQTLGLLGVTSLLAGDLCESAAYSEQSVPLLREIDDRQGLVSSLAVLGGSCRGSYTTDLAAWPVAESAEAARQGELARSLAREMGWRSGEAFAINCRAFFLGPRGEYGRALELARAGLAIAEEIEHREWATQAHAALGALYLDLLALPLARHHSEQALALAHQSRSAFWISSVTARLASTLVLQDDLAAARALLETVLRTDTPPQTLAQRQCWAVWAELALAQGDPRLALDMVDRLEAAIGDVGPATRVPHVLRLRGEALARMGRADEAAHALDAACEAARRRGTPPALWRAELALGHLHRGQSRRAQAEDAYARARHIVAELASRIQDAELSATFTERALASVPLSSQPAIEQTAIPRSDVLTERECEVAVLLARGLTNRQIAAELVISEGTATVHVKHILAKLDFHTRSQVAVWAVQHRLLPSA